MLELHDNSNYNSLLPVLVESSATILGQMLCPDSGEGAQTVRSLDVADNADDDHRRSLQNRHSLDNLLLVHLCKVKQTNY